MKASFRNRNGIALIWQQGRFAHRQCAPLTRDETARAAQLDALRFALEDAGDAFFDLMELCRALADMATDKTPMRRVAEVAEATATRGVDGVCNCLNSQFKRVPVGDAK